MDALTFPGTYFDSHGQEEVTWRIQSSQKAGWARRYEIRTVIRGVEVWGADFDGLEPLDSSADGTKSLSLDVGSGELSDCILSGAMPCQIEDTDGKRNATINFLLDLRSSALQNPASPTNLKLSISLSDHEFSVADDWFEDGLRRLEELLPEPVQLVCCMTCLYSDYSPGGHGLMGMSCHRDAKAAYLAVKCKADYFNVPVTEEVPETYLCHEYQRRVPGTGYRG